MLERARELSLRNVWRSCNKIRAAIFRTGLDLWKICKPLDQSDNGLISRIKFISVFLGPLKKEIGLSDQEIYDLADYFKIQDGRVYYSQLCEVVHGEGNDDLSRNPPLTSGLEWDFPYHVNVLSVSEERRLRVLLTKLATTVSARRLLLRPYFQDYELIAKNNGAVTLPHFYRIFHFLKIYLSDDDYHILVKKFLKNGYTVNYIAFLSALDLITKELIKKGNFDVGGDLLSQFPGRIINAELPKLPRPEVELVSTKQFLGNIYHAGLEVPRINMNFKEVMLRIQKYVCTESVRIREYFKDFDKLNSGRVTESVFRRCLDAVGISEYGPKRIYLSPVEIDLVVDYYRERSDPTRILWKAFVSNFEQETINRDLEKNPEAEIMYPCKELKTIPRTGNMWNKLTQDERDKCEDILSLIKIRVLARRIQLRSVFGDMDQNNNGHVTRRQFRTVLLANGILLTNDQQISVEQRFYDEMGVNYRQFVDEIELQPDEDNMTERYDSERLAFAKRKVKMVSKACEKNIVAIIVKIKRKVARYGLRLIDFMKPHDPNNQFVISEYDFRRSLDPKLELTPTEMETLIQAFKALARPNFVDYRQFCDKIEEVFTQKDLHRTPLIEPIQHIPIDDGENNFLNFEERQALSSAMQKIVKKNYPNLIDFYRSMDGRKLGFVLESDVLRGLTTVKLHEILSVKEVNAITKGFTKMKGDLKTFNYIAFCDAIARCSN